MGLMDSALQIGRSAITSYQSALTVVGNNIANAADPNYTRQRVDLNPILGSPLPEGMRPGGGVELGDVERLLNESLEERLRDAGGESESAQVTTQALSRMESIFNEMTDNDLSSMMNQMFASFQDVQNNPTDVSLRGVAVGNASSLADAIRAKRQDLQGLIDEANDQIVTITDESNKLAEQVAGLNVQIVEAEAGGHVASALRDQRDGLLKQLSQYIQIAVKEQDSGAVTVFVGNEPLVQLGKSRGLVAVPKVENDTTRYEVRFGDNSGQVDVRGGKLYGLIKVRDQDVGGVISQLDQFTAGLISAVNEIHTNGQGLEGLTSTTGTVQVLDPDAALNTGDAGLWMDPQTGSFYLATTDVASGITQAYQINVDLDGLNDNDTTLNGLVAAINAAVPNVTAAVTTDNKLSITAAAGFEFTFGHDGAVNRDDSSNVLAALGVNTLFSGRNASDIEVVSAVSADPRLLAAASANFEGDGTNAGQIASVGQNTIDILNNGTLLDYYNQIIGNLGVNSAAAQARSESADGVQQALETQRSSVSGVNLDEETIDLLKYERSYQSAAKYTSIVDQMISELMSMIQ